MNILGDGTDVSGMEKAKKAYPKLEYQIYEYDGRFEAGRYTDIRKHIKAMNLYGAIVKWFHV